MDPGGIYCRSNFRDGPGQASGFHPPFGLDAYILDSTFTMVVGMNEHLASRGAIRDLAADPDGHQCGVNRNRCGGCGALYIWRSWRG